MVYVFYVKIYYELHFYPAISPKCEHNHLVHIKLDPRNKLKAGLKMTDRHAVNRQKNGQRRGFSFPPSPSIAPRLSLR